MFTSNNAYYTSGQQYNATRKADKHIVAQLLQLLAPHPGGQYLDVGCGTGNYTCALATGGMHFTGVDPSATMLAQAQAACNTVCWLQGTAERMPTADDYFDGAIATLTIHHWADMAAAFRELARTLRPGAALAVFTALPTQMEGYWLNHYFPGMMKASITKMPSLPFIRHTSAEAGWTIEQTVSYSVTPDLEDRFLYAGKHQPGIYLDPATRKGISSFANLVAENELQDGLEQLQADLRSGVIERVQQQYLNDLGDYTFLVLKNTRR